jgi:glyoxylase-like metal-dependent hydrolase (beta-lactamase superfamily II)
MRILVVPVLCGVLLAGAACAPRPEAPPSAGAAASAATLSTPATLTLQGWCGKIPRAANRALPRAPITSDWFDIVEAAPGVYAFIEPLQFQEAVSYLIVGAREALLFDTGLGMVPLRPLVERLTRLPVTVLNSHTHYDHVGGNWEFDRILALETPYTRANMAGFAHAELATEVASDAFCRGAPAGLDTAAFRTRPWTATAAVRDGDTIDLGGRTLEVLHVPGHTPDAVALLDRTHGLLFTGDSYYDGAIWLFVPETDLDAYDRSMARLAALAPALRQLLPAHNSAREAPDRLAAALDAVRAVRTGRATPTVRESGGRLTFTIGGVSILTAQPLLDGRAGDRTRGGSGLTAWP